MRVIIVGTLLLICAAAAAQDEERFDRLDRHTPRSTVLGYLAAIDNGDAARAAEFLDLRNLPAEVAQYSPEQIARGLSLVLQRGLWIDFERLSEDPLGHRNDGLPSYRDELGVVETSDGPVTLLLQRVPGDEVDFVWKFSNATIARLPSLYEEYRHNAYVEWLARTLPAVSFLGLELFKWVASLSVAAALAPLLLLLAWWLARLIVKPGKPMHGPVRRFLQGPVTALALVSALDYVVHDLGLGAQAQAISRARTVTILVTLWLIWQAVNVLREAYAERLRKLGRDASIPLLRPLGTALKCVFIILGLLVWLDNVGYEITALLTGLGIGGVAVALVLQKPLEDILGAISLYTQQPIRIGDFGRFGGYSGTIEEITLRSTRIRTLENTLVSVPNTRMSSEPIENLSARTRILYQPVLRLRNDTGQEALVEVLEAIRALLKAHEHVIEEGARVRFTGIEGDGFEVRVFAYVDETAWPRYLEIAEELNLAILERLRKAGVSLAVPLQHLLEAHRG